MRFGKLSADELQKSVLDKLRRSRKEVKLSAAQGEDCAAIVSDGDFILLSSDPITAAMPPDKLGALAVNVCCNDVAANGGEPFALMFTVIVPPDCGVSVIESVMSGASAKAAALNVDIIGGHTEFSDCVTRPIVSGTAIGKCRRLMAKTALREGDKLFVTKWLGMEGTTIIADGGNEELSKEETLICESYREGLSVVNESRILSACPSVSVMHDVTEGGVIGAVAEICLGCGKGARIYESKFPVSAITAKLCAKYGINAGRLISSGSMLFAACDYIPAEALEKEGITVTEIGEVTGGEVILLQADGVQRKVVPEADELYKYLTRCG